MRLTYLFLIAGAILLFIGFGLLIAFESPLIFGRNPALSAQTADQNDGYVEGVIRATTSEEVRPETGNQEARK